jgi:hypothetical protein
MDDRIFFPLAAILAGTFVFMALDPYADRPPTGPVSAGGRNVQDLTVAGRELHRFILGEGKGMTLDVEMPAGGAPVLRIDRETGNNYLDPRLGPHLVVAEDLEYALESRPIEVIIEARSTGDFPASSFEANYFAKVDGESGWQSFPLTREFAPYTLAYFTPRRGRDEGYDYIGIRPVAPDKHRQMEIRSVRIRQAGPKGTPPTPTAAPM